MDIWVSQRNRFFRGETLEVLLPGARPLPLAVSSMWDADGKELEAANHAEMTVWIPCPTPLDAGLLLRRRLEKQDA